MNTINDQHLIGQLKWRYATKQFDPARKIKSNDWAALEEALVLTPSSYGLQPWKFIVVTDQAMRQKLAPVSWGQPQITDASHLVVFAIKKDLSESDIDGYIDRIARVRGIPRESLVTYRDRMVGSVIKNMSTEQRRAWAARQTYIALGTFLTSAAMLGIDACPMEGFDPAKYDEVLGLDKKGLSAVVIATAGYRAPGDKYSELEKVRFPREEVLLRV